MDDIALVVGILQDAFPTVPVSTEVPSTRPTRLITVDLTADASDELMHRPTISLMVWGTSDADAHSLALSALHALSEASMTHDLLSAVSLQTMARDEWSGTGQARYLVQIDLTINT